MNHFQVAIKQQKITIFFQKKYFQLKTFFNIKYFTLEQTEPKCHAIWILIIDERMKPPSQLFGKKGIRSLLALLHAQLFENVIV